jgi:hypothetical protein
VVSGLGVDSGQQASAVARSQAEIRSDFSHVAHPSSSHGRRHRSDHAFSWSGSPSRPGGRPMTLRFRIRIGLQRCDTAVRLLGALHPTWTRSGSSRE